MSNIATALSFRKKTNNWLHFFLCCITIGMWTWIWVALLVMESRNNEKVFRNIELANAGQSGSNQYANNAVKQDYSAASVQ